MTTLPKLTREEFYRLLSNFLELIERENTERMDATGLGSLNTRAREEGRRCYDEHGYDEGSRFIRVWSYNGTQRMVRYFVEKDTGIIFGNRGWKAYNPVRVYGDLTTMEEWEWGAYYAVSKTGKSTLVPKADRR